MERDDLDKENTEKKKKKGMEDETKATKRMPSTGRNRKIVFGAGKNSCAGPEITR